MSIMTMANRKLDAIPDPTDFRDRLFEPTLIEVPLQIELDDYRQYNVPVLDQENEGACTGFGLTTVANYLLRRRQVRPDKTPVSPRMFYEMAKRYDIWPGEDYEGSSARAAMKGWHKHGVCSMQLWPYVPGDAPHRNGLNGLTRERTEDAVKRPLGAYYRVNPKDLIAMHSALAEVGVLYAAAIVHDGWGNPTDAGIIEPAPALPKGHAFAIVAYNQDGFWIQNSWGTDWGKGGFALITYDDWLDNAKDVWVARLGVPIRLKTREATATSLSDTSGKSDTLAIYNARQHLVSVGNDGKLREKGTYGTGRDDIKRIFEVDFPEITKTWNKKRLLLYAHGGLVGEKSAVQRVTDYRSTFLKYEIYPLAFIWKTDAWTTLKNILYDAFHRCRSEGYLDESKNFLLDRLDDALEPLVRLLTGKAQWDEMKENGTFATQNAQGAGRIVLEYLAKLLGDDPTIEIHILSHSAGSIFLAPIIQLLTTSGKIDAGRMKGKKGRGLKVKTCTLLAPAITIERFNETYKPAIDSGFIEKFALYTLTDEAEQDDHCAHIYNKSLLYLVSNALEKKLRIPLLRPDGEPLLGMQKFVDQDDELRKMFSTPQTEWVLAPNNAEPLSMEVSKAQHHGDFDDDLATMRSTLFRILDNPSLDVEFNFPPSASKLRDQRNLLPD